MLTKEDMIVVKQVRIAKDTYELILEGELTLQMNEPGQFIHLQIGNGREHVLRRPISMADVNGNQLTIVYRIMGAGTKWLAEREAGDAINVLAPLGNGFPTHAISNTNILLVGGGVGVPPLYYLGKKLKAQGNRLTTVLGFQTKDAVFYEQRFRELGDCIVTTNDGSYGQTGFVTDVISGLTEINRYYACGPTPMLKAVSQQISVPGYISLEERMGCGVGACFACVCSTIDGNDKKGYRKICQDGPVFPANEVVLV
ncbi:dihydroorotate dehydrogenase electron transfer subunit [Pontibacillus salicampi]|uniref:Dihydroorotate dehydrogenase B (NAD(+)), electron transfer subunit n=1 Tax=Pontibacillus salicampi TaxID=1449801 RepID=A0ABV6LP32_9BACI